MRNPQVNGTILQFLHIQIIAIIFVILMFFMLVFVAQQLTYLQIYYRTSSTIYQRYSSAFQMTLQLPKVGQKFLKVGENFDYKQRLPLCIVVLYHLYKI